MMEKYLSVLYMSNIISDRECALCKLEVPWPLFIVGMEGGGLGLGVFPKAPQCCIWIFKEIP